MTPVPTQLALDAGGALLIEWNDGQRRRYTVKELRDHCPCASCRERRAAATTPLLPVLTAAEARPLSILGMEPVGHYAYSIRFSDGHSTGIYTLELLRSLGESLPPGQPAA
ncbi:MAG: DUF971 domain-containing protein [Pirellulales bacterium]|nr:DUF971 domain-containing protein [Pirellulales bacterium]